MFPARTDFCSDERPIVGFEPPVVISDRGGGLIHESFHSSLRCLSRGLRFVTLHLSLWSIRLARDMARRSSMRRAWDEPDQGSDHKNPLRDPRGTQGRNDGYDIQRGLRRGLASSANAWRKRRR